MKLKISEIIFDRNEFRSIKRQQHMAWKLPSPHCCPSVIRCIKFSPRGLINVVFFPQTKDLDLQTSSRKVEVINL